MNSHFHTPSFGDEDFALDLSLELNSVPTQNWQTNNNLNESGYLGGETDLLNTNDNQLKYESNENQLTSKQKLKKNLTEPKKPVSAYAAFFRDTQIAIKGQNPNVDFTEVSKIVSSMWEALDPEHKNVYKKNAELAKIEYVKNLAEYRSNILSSSPPQTIPQQQVLINAPLKQVPIASKPAVFTIPRLNSLPELANVSQKSNSLTSKKSNMSPRQISRENSIEEPNVNMLAAEAGSVQKCIRDGCQNRAIVNPDWEDEYCSNECVIKHCQDVFTKWIQSNSMTQSQPESISILN